MYHYFNNLICIVYVYYIGNRVLKTYTSIGTYKIILIIINF